MLKAGAELVIIFGASAIADRRDVIPAAVEAVGGRIEHFGMPVDPGNLLLVGAVRGRPVLGAPGCARSPKENGFDWVLMRLLAGLEVPRAAITGLGVGGLLMEIVTRPQPRDEPVADSRRVAAIVLAAGRSTRMGGPNKLVAEIAQRPLVRIAAEEALASRAKPVIVVTGHQRPEVEKALAGLPVRIVHNPDFAEGLGTSLRAGIMAVPPDADSVIVCLGDMPQVDASLIDRLIAAFDLRNTDIAAPDYFHKVVDCQWACPAHTPVPEYIRLIAAGRYSDAYMVNWKSNVFPGILGRTCDRPCEPACRRGRVGEGAGAICRLKRVAADNKDDIRDRLPKPAATKNGKRVALVGAGPASLTVARDLAPLGYDFTMFDGDTQAGGMIRTQIPRFRLPESVIDEEVGYILDLGVEFVGGKRIDSLKALLAEGLRRDLRRHRRAARARPRHSRPQGSRGQHPHRHRLAVERFLRPHRARSASA